jgi:hypothetical protein
MSKIATSTSKGISLMLDKLSDNFFTQVNGIDFLKAHADEAGEKQPAKTAFSAGSPNNAH